MNDSDIWTKRSQQIPENEPFFFIINRKTTIESKDIFVEIVHSGVTNTPSKNVDVFWMEQYPHLTELFKICIVLA